MKTKQPIGLRPVGARALKSATDTLRPYLFEAKCLDLFSGQGRFGISALEEGAESVTFVETHPKISRELRNSLSRFGKKAEVRQEDAFHYLQESTQRSEKYEVIFADPPFEFWDEGFSEKLQSAVRPLLVPSAIFLVKIPSRVVASQPIQGLSLWKSSQFGESKLIYWYAEQIKS